MTAQRNLKARIRARMAKTGEAYTTARTHVLRERERLIGAHDIVGHARPETSARLVAGSRLSVEVDPRYELVNVLARLALLPECANIRPTYYSAEVDAHFRAFEKHPAVATLKRLRSEQGFGYGYLIGLATKARDVETFVERMPCEPPHWDKNARWTAEEARAFTVELRDFARTARWAAFQRQKLDHHQEAVRRLESILDRSTIGDWLDEYLGTRGNTRFILTPGSLVGQAMWATINEFPDATNEIFGFIGAPRGADELGIPLYEPADVASVIELFFILKTNAEVSIHAAELRRTTETAVSLFDPEIQDDFELWQYAIAGSLRRAIGARFLLATQGREAATRRLEQGGGHFYWLQQLFELFDQYEQGRDRYPSLHQFMPRVSEFFADFGASSHMERFRGEQRANLSRRQAYAPRIVALAPRDGAEGVDPDLSSIKVTFDRRMDPTAKALCKSHTARFPDLAEHECFDETRTVLTIPVRLEPNTQYALSFNAERLLGYRDEAGNVLMPTPYRFRTGPGKAQLFIGQL
jgi:hypothetical protein